MLISEALRRQIGREAGRFCRRCPAVEERDESGQVVYTCRASQCRLWLFLSLLGLRPGADFDAPTAEEALAEAHAREVRRFRGILPLVPPEHGWDADARFHGLATGLAPDADDEHKRTTDREETRWRS